MFHARPARRVRAFRPCLEVLEARHLLSTYLVDRLTDTGAGSGLTGDLRYCIGHTADGDAITFGDGLTGVITVGDALPTLTHSITIDGPGPGLLSIKFLRSDSLFDVSQGATVGISGLTLSHGIRGNPGRAIFNDGTLAVSSCMIAGNINVYGGANFNNGTLTISNSTISGNLAGNLGGGILNYGTLTISSSTISGNVAGSPDPFGDVGGGGIANDGTLIITNSTISDNQTGGYGYGIYNITTSATLTISNSILDDFYGYGSFTDMGHNLIGISGDDARLGPLQDNGGPTPTRALLPGSPALNTGDPDQLGVADQRGVLRSGGVNIGAYQASATAFALTASAAATAGAPFDVTVKAVDPFGQTAVGYTGTVSFSSSDGQAALPGDYTFTTADAGVHGLAGGATLVSAGSQVITATDTASSSLTGGASVSVDPAAADHLLFLQQPADTAAGQTIAAVTVAVVDPFGNILTGDNADTVTLSLGANPGGGALSGTLTVTVVNGVATFSDLSLDQAGDGYTLHAATAGLADADSAAFAITV
jgi:hypothetical protein